MKEVAMVCALILTVSTQAASGQSSSGNAVPVTVENFIRAESDMYLSAVALKENGFGKFEHHRELSPIDAQTIIRMNRDTLYSAAVFDLDAGAVTITLPDAGKRFMSMQLISQDEYSPPAAYGGGKYTITKQQVGTRYVLVGVRTLVDPNDPTDLKKVHALQDGLKVEQPGGPGKFEVPKWDPVSQKKVRDALLVLAGTLPDTNQMYGPRGKVDPIRHLIGTATGWGANAPEDATYVPVVPAKNDGKTVHRLTIKGAVPVDGFWSISVYGADGYFHVNDQNVYSINGTTARKDADGSITIQFGGCDGTVPNCMPITEGWNYWVRFYRPRKEILVGIYKFPEASAVAEGIG